MRNDVWVGGAYIVTARPQNALIICLWILQGNERKKVQLRFKEGRRQRTGLRAKLPEEPEMESEPKRNPAKSAATMTPGVITMNTKMTKSLRKALKKKQREREEMERQAKEQEERQAKEQEEKKRREGEKRMAESQPSAVKPREEEDEETITRDEDAPHKRKKSKRSRKEKKKKSGKRAKRETELPTEGETAVNGQSDTPEEKVPHVDSSYWDYLDDLDEEEIGLKVRIRKSYTLQLGLGVTEANRSLAFQYHQFYYHESMIGLN